MSDDGEPATGNDRGPATGNDQGPATGDDRESSATEGDPDPLTATLATVRERTTPSETERERLAAVTERLLDRARTAVASLPSPADEADVLRVGSTARGTWLPGDRDVDLFVRFPTTLDNDDLAEYGLRVGHETVPNGHEEYAEHPYVTGTVDGFDVDVVPCFDVADATAIRSAVDRTPFHTAYLRDTLDASLAADVRVCKQFLTAIGAYGSDLRTEGFSGYLTELLVATHGGVRALFEAAAAWDPPVRFDPADHGTTTFDDPLVVIDPTDPERNVAAVCSTENVARFQHHARRLLADPDPDRFERTPIEPVSRDTVREHLDRRGTEPVAVVFDAPDVVDDKLYPQLRRSLGGVEQELSDHGFEVVRSAVFTADESTAEQTAVEDDEKTGSSDVSDQADRSSDALPDGSTPAALFVELVTATVPAIERHEGPPVSVENHAEGFYTAYATDDVYGPFLDGDRYVVERERAVTEATTVLREELFSVALGANVESALRDGYTVRANNEIPRLADSFGTDLARYFDPRV